MMTNYYTRGPFAKIKPKEMRACKKCAKRFEVKKGQWYCPKCREDDN